MAQDKTFEVQVKVRSDDLTSLKLRLHASPDITFLRGSQRMQYDTYFIFDDQEESRLRYREDEVRHLDTNELIDVIYRLTLTTTAKEREYECSVLLSRARFDAAATRSRRFYQEYFKPQRLIEIHKTRRRYHIRYGGTDFALNLDQIIKPEDGGSYLEIKSRTWSRQDAERKAALIGELLKALKIPDEALIRAEYADL